MLATCDLNIRDYPDVNTPLNRLVKIYLFIMLNNNDEFRFSQICEQKCTFLFIVVCLIKDEKRWKVTRRIFIFVAFIIQNK